MRLGCDRLASTRPPFKHLPKCWLLRVASDTQRNRPEATFVRETLFVFSQFVCHASQVTIPVQSFPPTTMFGTVVDSVLGGRQQA